MTPISFDTAYQLARQRQQELEHDAALSRVARHARAGRRWNVLTLLRRRPTSSSVAPRPRPGRPITTVRPAPSSASVSRQTTDSVVVRDPEAGRAA